MIFGNITLSSHSIHSKSSCNNVQRVYERMLDGITTWHSTPDSFTVPRVSVFLRNGLPANNNMFPATQHMNIRQFCSVDHVAISNCV